MSKTHFTYKKLSESELKNLYNEIQNNQREMTEDELNSLMGMFWEKFGTSSYGMCMNPLFLLDTPDNPFNSLEGLSSYDREDEDELVKAWRDKSMLDLFDDVKTEIPNHSIDIMCDKPDDCISRKRYGNACRCIRENFVNEDQFFQWRTTKIKELKIEMKELLSKDEK